MSYLKDREIWLSSVPTGNPPAGYVWVFIQNGVFVVRDSSGVDKIMATTTGTVTNATSASYVEYSNVANKPALISGSSQVSYTGLSDIPAGIVSGSAQVSFNGITDKPALVSSSAQIVGYNVFATTGSNQFNGSQAITGSLTVTGEVVAQTLNVQQVTSSIVFSSGSNIFGNSVSNTQQFTGSLQVTGSTHYVLGNMGIGTTSPDVFSRGDERNVGISVPGASDNLALALNAGGSAGRGAQIYMGQGGTRHLTISSNVTETRVGTTTSTPLILTTNDTTRLTIAASTGAATFSSSVTANNLVIRNTGVPAAQFFRDVDVVSVGTAGQGIEFGARSGSTFIAGASIYGGLDNPATTGNLVFQTLNGGTLGTRLTITNTGAATFSSSVTAPFLRITDSAGEIGEINSTNANGGYITWRTSGTTIADIGTAQQIFGTGGNDTFGINGRGARALTLGTNNTERMRITSDGNVAIGVTSTANSISGTERILEIANSNVASLYLNSTGGKRYAIYSGGSGSLVTYDTTGGGAARLILDTNGNFGVGYTSPNKFGVLDESAKPIRNYLGNSNNQGRAQNYKIVRHIPVVSAGNKLIIPFTSQGNLNSNTIVKIMGHSARYNSRAPLGFSAYFAVGHLSVLSDLNAWEVNGNISSIGYGGGMNIDINFSTAYTSAEANGLFITIEYMTNTSGYSINVAGITMN
jgi:hypothetical protein